MFFSSRNALYGALAGLVAAGGVRADSCSDGPFEDSSKMVFGAKGYNPNTPFCHTNWQNGLVVTGIEVWATKYHVAGVQFTYSDGSSSPIQGNTDYGSNKQGNDRDNKNNYRHDLISWPATEKITKMELATSKDGRALGYIHIEVAGKKLEVGSDGIKRKETINTGAGLFLGAVGETNAFPSAWSPLFMGTNDGTAQITDMKFDQSLDDVNKKKNGITQVTLSEVYIQNSNPLGSNTNQTYTFTGATKKTQSRSTSTTKQNTFGLSQSITFDANFGVPLLAQYKVQSTTTASYQYQTATDQTTSSSDEQTLQWTSGATTTSDQILPQRAKHCTAYCIEGNYKGGYTSTVTIKVNGKSFSYQEKGVFESIGYSSAVSGCVDVAISEVPSGATTMEGTPVQNPSGTAPSAAPAASSAAPAAPATNGTAKALTKLFGRRSGQQLLV